MLKVLKYFGLFILVLIIGLYISIKLFLPKEWAVNAPVFQFITGIGGEVIPENELGTKIKLPEGFNINIYAKDLGHARGLFLTSTGDLILSTSRSGKVKVLLADRNGDGKADGVRTLLTDLNMPHGVEVHNGNLYVGETDAIVRVPYDIHNATINDKKLQRIVTGLPGGGNHFTRTVHFGPEGKMYVSIGSTCNVCIEDDPRRAALVRYNADGSNEEIYATGLRNTVGFTWHPQNSKLYSVDNGRDLLGDDFPPGEMNIVEQGKFYGWPFLNGNNIPDPDFGKHKDPRIANAVPPTHEFTAHVAPLSIIFLQSKNLPEKYQGAALVTLHGSWNRTKKSGYEIVSLHKLPDGRYVEKSFATGFMKNEKVFGRPVEIVEAPDGTIFFTDDFGSAVYRVTYGKQPANANLDSKPNVSTQQNFDRSEIEKGKKLFGQLGCNACHVVATKSVSSDIIALQNLNKRYNVKNIQKMLKVGPGPMPPYDLPDEQSSAIAKYLLSGS